MITACVGYPGPPPPGSESPGRRRRFRAAQPGLAAGSARSRTETRAGDSDWQDRSQKMLLSVWRIFSLTLLVSKAFGLLRITGMHHEIVHAQPYTLRHVAPCEGNRLLRGLASTGTSGFPHSESNDSSDSAKCEASCYT